MPLLERSLTMVYIEPVGTGASGFRTDPREYTPATYTHFLHAVIRHLALPDVVLLGHSHGGFVAQRYALDHPGRVAALILYDTSPVTDEGFWSAAVANLERFVQRHINEHPEVAGYVAALTARLDQLTDDGTTAVLRKITPAHFYDYWVVRRNSDPPDSCCGCTPRPPSAEVTLSTSAMNCPLSQPHVGTGRKG
ncbi:alpha/beta fold hydrolase [Streptomyces sp. NPDC051664]|uniref:alpha/beta fold hydrolase n=1 Tax=Streptomyces sp. NPDC051664 TaxID=3365668 RepID=UPI0037B321CC